AAGGRSTNYELVSLEKLDITTIESK
ncbi:MAG: hypothetical protein ACJAR8_001051, partial [Bacteroidia bacterium]